MVYDFEDMVYDLEKKAYILILRILKDMSYDFFKKST